MVYPALLLLMRTPRLPVVDWTGAPADLHGLVRFAERRNLVSARVPSQFNWPLPRIISYWIWSGLGASPSQTWAPTERNSSQTCPERTTVYRWKLVQCLTGSISCMEVDFSCLHIVLIASIQTIFVLFIEKFSLSSIIPNSLIWITPLLLCRASFCRCLTVRCSSSWTVLHEHTAGNFYWTLDWHCSGRGHYCARGTVVWPISRDDHSYIRWPVLPAWEHE